MGRWAKGAWRLGSSSERSRHKRYQMLLIKNLIRLDENPQVIGRYFNTMPGDACMQGYGLVAALG